MAAKKLILFLPLFLVLPAITVGCLHSYSVSPLTASAAPTPTFTPAFTSCTPTAMLTPNPWPNTMVASILFPAFTGIEYLQVQIFDSTYTQQNSESIEGVSSPTTLTISNENQYGVIFSPGNYYLEVTEEVPGGGSTCYFEPITIN